jgi:hypothetical protein
VRPTPVRLPEQLSCSRVTSTLVLFKQERQGTCLLLDLNTAIFFSMQCRCMLSLAWLWPGCGLAVVCCGLAQRGGSLITRATETDVPQQSRCRHRQQTDPVGKREHCFEGGVCVGPCRRAQNRHNCQTWPLAHASMMILRLPSASSWPPSRS